MVSSQNADPEQVPGAGPSAFPNTTTRPELLVDRSDQKLRQLVHDLTALSARIEQVRSQFAKRLGISGPQYNVLQFVAQNQGDHGITVSKVADGLLVTGAYVTKEVNQLIARGFIDKTPNPDDGRSVLLRLSSHGASRLDELAPALQHVNDDMFRSLDQERFVSVSGTIHDILKDAEKTARRVSYYLED